MKTKGIVYKGLVLTIACWLLASCYPLATGSVKWRIVWKPAIKDYKKEVISTISNNERSPDQPINIILIVADDLGKAEVSAYGSNRVPTPHIDQIGKEGVIFTDAYVSSPVCAPSRAGLMTGRIQNRFGFETQSYEQYPTNMIEYVTGRYLAKTENWVVMSKPVFPREWQIIKQGLPPSEINIAELLKAKDYKTASIGKWHLGHHRRLRPLARGFDYQYGFYGASTIYTPEQETPGYATHIQNSFSSKYQWKNERNGLSAIVVNDKKITENDYLTFAIRDQANDFIEKHKEEPFFLYVPFNAPHVPFQAPQAYYDQFAHIADDNKRVYYAMIAALDDAVGDIHQKVIDAGLEEQTMIIFISDNGGASYTGATDNYPLKGGKLTQFEGGLNVPFVMKWKNNIPAGTVYDKAVSSLDIFTTIAAAANLKLPKDRVYDGVDLMPYILNEETTAAVPHDVMYWRADHICAIRKGIFKLIMSSRDGWVELYNLKEDKSEHYDLRKEYPEIVQNLIEEHLAWQRELPEKPLWPKFMDYRFVIDSTEYMFPP